MSDSTEVKTTKTEEKKAAKAASTRLVNLCDQCRKDLYMLETNHRSLAACDRCGTTGTLTFQYARADVRLDHLPAAERNELNANLDALAVIEAAQAKAAEEAAAAAQKASDDAYAALVASNDQKYAVAVAARQALETA